MQKNNNKIKSNSNCIYLKKNHQNPTSLDLCSNYNKKKVNFENWQI